ncbi:MAG: DNA methylase, partial [Flavisolibacter sp.]|nr:DNA methylase [Flavisolibacter sp.]
RAYKNSLQYEKDGAKSNPIQLNDCKEGALEAIGKHLIHLSAAWKPKPVEDDNLKIGVLYGFDLYIRRQKEPLENGEMLEYRYQNVFYAQSRETEIKYMWNQGYLNIDNPKLAARHFLNSIDRVEALKDKYEKNLRELDQNIPMLQQLTARSFEKETELAQLKLAVVNLEREIAIKIQKAQLTQQCGQVNIKGTKEAPVIKMEKPLLPKKEVAEKKVKSLRI